MSLVAPQSFGTGSLQSGLGVPSIIPTIPEGTIDETRSSSPLSEFTTDNDPYCRASTGPPASEIPLSQVLNSDITMPCMECGQYVDLAGLRDHRNYHQALKLMEYTMERPPPDVKDLVIRRQLIMNRYIAFTNCDHPLDPLLVQRINEAFEFLKAEVENTFDECRKIRESRDYEQRGYALGSSTKCIRAVGICADGNSRWKTDMQDSKVYQDCFGSDMSKSYIAVFDGHHGPFAAEIAAENLQHALLNQMSRFDRRTKCDCTYNLAEYEQSLNNPHEVHSRVTSKYTERGELYQESVSVIHKLISDCEQKLLELLASGKEVPDNHKKKKQKVSKDPFSLKMANAFTKAYKYTDMLLSWGKEEESRVRWSGCSALTCVIQDYIKDKENDKDREILKDENKAQEESESNPSNVTSSDGLDRMGIIHLANAGNTKAVLVRDNKAYMISKDHSPQNVKEKKRVTKAGGQISNNEKELLVNGVLLSTRGLGNHGDPPLKKCVITEPYTTSVQIDQYTQCLILASRGVWEVFSEQEAANLIVQLLPPNHLEAPSHISASINRLLARSVASSHHSALSTARTSELDDQSIYNPDGLDLFNKRRSAIKKSRPNTSKSILSTGSRVSHTSQVSFASEVEALRTNTPSSVSTELDVNSEILSSSKQSEGTEMNKTKYKETEEIDDFENECDQVLEDSGEEGDVETLSNMSEESMGNKTQDIYKQFAQLLSERLTEAALMAGARDNITVMVVLFPGCGLDWTDDDI